MSIEAEWDEACAKASEVMAADIDEHIAQPLALLVVKLEAEVARLRGENTELREKIAALRRVIHIDRHPSAWRVDL